MGLSHTDWRNIQRTIDDAVSSVAQPAFAQGTVIKADANRNIVWLKEFGDQPIPVFAFDYEVRYYDTQPVGNVTTGQPVNINLIRKNAKVRPLCPKVGDIVLVARQHGSRSLPKCLGVLRSTDFEALATE